MFCLVLDHQVYVSVFIVYLTMKTQCNVVNTAENTIYCAKLLWIKNYSYIFGDFLLNLIAVI